MLFEDGKLKASVVNEFGLSAMDFEYNPQKDKVKIINIIKKLDHWYIKRVLKRDLRILLHNLEHGIYKHENAKYEITYTFQPLQPITEEAPAAFVYTLPNITTGEIALRNGYHGETSFYLLAERNEKLMQRVIKSTFIDRDIKSVIGGWIDCPSEDKFECDIRIYVKE